MENAGSARHRRRGAPLRSQAVFGEHGRDGALLAARQRLLERRGIQVGTNHTVPNDHVMQEVGGVVEEHAAARPDQLRGGRHVALAGGGVCEPEDAVHIGTPALRLGAGRGPAQVDEVVRPSPMAVRA